MCIYIGIEDLVANALIEVAEKSDRHMVLFKELNNYGARVIEILNQKEERAMLIVSQEEREDFLHDYTEYFELVDIEGEQGIALRKGVSIDTLWERFRGYLAADVMMAFMSRESLEALGVKVA